MPRITRKNKKNLKKKTRRKRHIRGGSNIPQNKQEELFEIHFSNGNPKELYTSYEKYIKTPETNIKNYFTNYLVHNLYNTEFQKYNNGTFKLIFIPSVES